MMAITNNGGPGTNPPPTYVVGAPAAIASSKSSPGCCATPGATPAVKRTRGISIAIIVFHAICLAAIGFIFWAQWIASLAGIIMGSILLCVFQKGSYIAAAIVFGIGGIFDIVAMIDWIQLAQAFDELGEDTTYYYRSTDTTTTFILTPTIYNYHNTFVPNYNVNYKTYTTTTSDVDEITDEWGEAAKGLAVLPAIAALLMFIGTAFAINAVMTWDQIGTQAGPKVVEKPYPVGGNIVARATIPVSAQPHAANAVGGKGPPPPYVA